MASPMFDVGQRVFRVICTAMTPISQPVQIQAAYVKRIIMQATGTTYELDASLPSSAAEEYEIFATFDEAQRAFLQLLRDARAAVQVLESSVV